MLKQTVKRLLLTFAWLWVSGCLADGTTQTLLLDASVDSAQVTADHLLFLEDPDDSLSVNEITTIRYSDFQPAPSDILNLGHSASSIWVTFSINDLTESDSPTATWLVEVGYPLLKRVDIYVVDEANQIVQRHKLGYSMKMAQREIQNRFFVQPIQIDRNENYRVFINVMRKNGSIQVPVKLYRPGSFLLSEIQGNYVFGIFFGILFAMVIYNIYLYLFVGSRAYLYYILYIATAATSFLTITGYGFLFVWSQFPLVNEYALQVPSLLAAITGALFVRHFILVKNYYQYIDTAISAMVAVGVFLLGLRLVTDYFLSEAISAYLGLISIVTPIMAYQCFKKGSRSAGFFLIGWATLFVGIILYTASLLGVLPSNALTNNAVLVGAALETVLLSLGLADRINSERKEKFDALKAQHEATVQLKETENQLVHRALHSGITGLPNRSYLRSKLEAKITHASDQNFVIVLVSLNNFHEINKTLGHSNGDAILYLATQKINGLCGRIQNIVELEKHENGIHHLAGIEGITFAFVIDECQPGKAQSIVQHFLRDLEKPLRYQGLSLDIDVSASMACYPQHGANSETLIRNAHIALEAASVTNEKMAVYCQDIDPYNEKRISLIGELRNAIKEDQLQLYYQPQINLATQKVEGAEVLVRWIHPEYGFIPPDEFIPLAEKTGVIRPLTYWICGKAFQFKSEMAKAGHHLKLSINISARNLQDPAFKKQVCQLASEQKIALDEIIMELTETAVMTDPDNALKMMNSLTQAGIKLSIDDFGTGYSSLSYLKKLPVNELKIDRSFIMEMAKSAEDQQLVLTTLTMGHNFSMTVVAEGIEDQDTLYMLARMGCDYAQGYHIAKPMPAEAFFSWLHSHAGEQGTSFVSVGGLL